jgi:hypothetical protein
VVTFLASSTFEQTTTPPQTSVKICLYEATSPIFPRHAPHALHTTAQGAHPHPEENVQEWGDAQFGSKRKFLARVRFENAEIL